MGPGASLQGDEDVLEADRKTVASLNATVMGYAMKQIATTLSHFRVPAAPAAYSSIDRRLRKLLQDPNLKVREDRVDLSSLVDELSSLTVIELADLAKMLEDKWRISSCVEGRS